ncbi:hypothetical protein [Cellulomonas sp.]|uniref:hypothetical protein n=1 Tax=Cellulomonas sp. TaxID=40001 RepID=UPI003450FD3C
MFSGDAQFAFIGVLGPSGAVSKVATAGLLGTPERSVRSAGRSDAADDRRIDRRGRSAARPGRVASGFWWTGIGVFVLGDPRRYGLDAAAAAVFLGLVWPRLGTRIARAAAGLAIVVTLGRTPFVPAGLPVLAASVVRFALKLVGHLLPSHWLAEPRVARTAALVTVALLAVLVGVQTFTTVTPSSWTPGCLRSSSP